MDTKVRGEASRETEIEWLCQKLNCKAGGEELILLYVEGGKEKVGLWNHLYSTS